MRDLRGRLFKVALGVLLTAFVRKTAELSCSLRKDIYEDEVNLCCLSSICLIYSKIRGAPPHDIDEDNEVIPDCIGAAVFFRFLF